MLSPAHRHEVIDNWPTLTNERLRELRLLYVNDPEALAELDIHIERTATHVVAIRPYRGRRQVDDWD